MGQIGGRGGHLRIDPSSRSAVFPLVLAPPRTSSNEVHVSHPRRRLGEVSVAVPVGAEGSEKRRRSVPRRAWCVPRAPSQWDQVLPLLDTKSPPRVPSNRILLSLRQGFVKVAWCRVDAQRGCWRQPTTSVAGPLRRPFRVDGTVKPMFLFIIEEMTP
jgi:hypothetical protein